MYMYDTYIHIYICMYMYIYYIYYMCLYIYLYAYTCIHICVSIHINTQIPSRFDLNFVLHGKKLEILTNTVRFDNIFNVNIITTTIEKNRLHS
jgi:hypothetical protein